MNDLAEKGGGTTQGKSTSREILEKYRELYLLSEKASINEIDRIRRVEEKAAKLISLSGILITLAALAGKFVFYSLVPPEGLNEYCCLAAYIFFAISLVYAFINLILSFRAADIHINPMDQEMISFFDNNSHLNILYALARNNANATALNRAEYSKKFKRLKCSYWAIFFSIISMPVFIVFMILSLAYKTTYGG